MAVLCIGHLGPVHLGLRDPAGHDEAAIEATAPAASAMKLAQCMAVLPEGQTLEALPVALLHRLYLAMYRHLFSGPIESHSHCETCQEAFEFLLDLDAIDAEQHRRAVALPPPEADWWTLESGQRLRVPLVSDLEAGSPDALLARLSDGQGHDQAVQAEQFLEQAAPLLDFDLDTACPHCGADQQVRFSMPAFLVARLQGEWPRTLREIHLLASAYHWSRMDCLTLRRRDRQTFAAMIQSERAAAARPSLQVVS